MTKSSNNAITVPKDDKAKLPVLAEYVPAEMFLENIGFFTPSSTKKSEMEKTKVLGEKIGGDGEKKTVKVTVSANATLGLPMTSDLDYYRAFLKVLDEVADREGHIKLPVRVPSKRLVALAGKEWGGKTKAEVGEWFERMTGTLIKGGMYRAKSKTYEDGFSGVVFSQVLRKGDRLKDGTIADTNYVWLSPWFLSNYYYRYVRPIDLNFHRRLTRPIAKSLYPLLETGWYASNGNPYTKHYSDLCTEFLLSPFKQLSRIKQQLDPAHRELQEQGYLDSWDYREATERHGYVIAYYAGPKFFHDQKARKERKLLARQINEPSRPEEEGSRGTPLATFVHEIVEVTGDRESIRYYAKLVRELPEHKVWELISLTKQAKLEGQIRTTPARFFTDLAERELKLRKNSGSGRTS